MANYPNYTDMIKQRSEDLKTSAAAAEAVAPEASAASTLQVKRLPNGKYMTAEGVLLQSAEMKSKRLQLLVWPSLHTELRQLAEARHTTLNDLINTVLKDYVTSNS